MVLETRPADDAPDRNQVIVREADYIAKVKPRQKLPWRVFMLADQDKELLTNDLVFQLSRPLQIENPDWIKPGTVAWDWWNALNIYGVDFESGINTETYKYYIDFASEYGLDYIILDEGWSQSTTNIKESNPDIDIHELVRYGEEKNVGVILWMLWGPLNRDMQEILERYADWGVKGIKVDFMQRSDQDMVLFYERCARIAAENQLLVNYHGAFKPTGLRRAYPNVVNFEGVKGLENCKWTDVITPEHDVTLPFIRMAVGPMDYTPGAMDNAHPVNFSARFTRPMSQGTRCHQAAMYVVYEAPLQMLSDSPSNYYREPETTEFISSIPTVWDSTVVLAAKVADYIAVARRHNDVWYVGAMTDGSPRTIILNLSFLSTGTYQADIMQDGTNAAKNAIDYERVKKQVTAETRLEIHMAPGGGWAGKFKAFRN
ncbi:MAG: glycoside hydrolase family 97 catalytic domain-containing protein [candidate division KSB1 bacterium]|nr:glycoside hydrolase family 97 catalytic domain-containing protein [candidate division KSB1 bacterium]